MPRPSLLLHACCAPCSSTVLERLAPDFDVTVYYYNPNIHPAGEYRRRLEELQGFVRRFPPAAGAALVEAAYDPEDYYAATDVRNQAELRTEMEKGERCFRCYRFRMQKAFEYAAKNGFDFMAATLSVSPHKDSANINAIGKALEEERRREAEKTSGLFCPTFLCADFKKQDGFKRSLALSAEYNLYRQDYCGCEFSMRK
jgi:predicted adenine nucleotide alpha hydrolase (AANH) superfamily ATPase